MNLIKVYSRLEGEGFLAIVDEARKCGLKAVGHIPESVSLQQATGGGLDSSEHFFGFEKAIGELLGEKVTYFYNGMGSQAGFLEQIGQVNQEELEDLYKQVADSGMTVCPTVITFKVGTGIKDFQAGNFPRQEYISPMVMGVWSSMWGQQDNLPDYIWQNWAQMVKGLSQAGVPLLVGTDLMIPGIFPGFSVHEEMVLWQQAGIPPLDVLRSATLIPAQFLGLADRLGSVKEGKTASLLLVRGNPLDDVRNAQQIEGVFLRGQYFNRKMLSSLLEEAKEAAQPAES